MTSGFNIKLPDHYRDEACKEVMAANRDRLLGIVKAVTPITSSMDLSVQPDDSLSINKKAEKK